MKTPLTLRSERGFLMIEVLITIFILLVGLLGIVGLQARSQQAETESYQRTQALMLLRDMADRMNANRANAASYVTGTSTPLGTGSPIGPCAAPATAVERDQCAWRAALLGAAETSSGSCNVTTGANCVGAMIGARGCITVLDAANRIYLIEVVWQGLSPTAAPPSGVICGKTASFGGDELRRAVTTIVQIGDLGT
jgi:type IV pilus assembly protein PilV